MQTHIKLYIILLITILTIACKKEKITIGVQTDYDKEILEAINQYRLSLGKNTLEHNDFIWQWANQHSVNMANGDVPFGHEGLTERSDTIFKVLSVGNIAENVATGQGSATELLNSWLASSGHKLNIEGNFTLTGLSAVKAKNGKWYYTQIFYKPNP